MAIAALRIEVLDETQLARLLDMDRTTITKRMLGAEARIARQLPEAVPVLVGRCLQRGLHPKKHENHNVGYPCRCLRRRVGCCVAEADCH
jgi:hypothetical protein